MATRKTPGAGGPRLSSFGKKTNDGDSLSPGDMKVPDRYLYKMVGGRPTKIRTDVMVGGGPGVAPNENAGRPDPEFARKNRPLFTQRYYRKSSPHQDYLFGNQDSRREIVDEGNLN
jgi:hypothetical protein